MHTSGKNKIETACINMGNKPHIDSNLDLENTSTLAIFGYHLDDPSNLSNWSLEYQPPLVVNMM